MNPTLRAVLLSWPLDPWIVIPLVLTAWVYVRGWSLLHRRAARRFGCLQLVAFLGGLVAIFLALASPIEPFAGLLLQVHMIQHLLLMMIAPPLLWLGAPALPLLRGLPLSVRRQVVGPLLQNNDVRGVFHWLTRPVTAWLLYVGVSWFWHVPPLYELALRSDGWHYVEHASFLFTALLFWFPVIQPYPSQPAWSRWLLVPYLVLADVQNTLLAALLTFADVVIYPHYALAPRLGNMSALEDQAMAGVIMWVPGSLAFLVPLGWIGYELLYGRAGRVNAPMVHARGRFNRGVDSPRSPRMSLPLVAPAKASLVHRFLRWRHARRALQLPLLLLAFVIIIDGLLGPEIAPMNLAGVLPWIHWRGLVVLGLLIAGNVFCMACPFMLPRTLARRWLPANHAWPRWLRGKWLALGLLVLFFWGYETFSLWDSPWWTAWIALAYFLAALLIDGWFRGAAFCKYVCPIGQFQFVQSLVSPLEVRVRDRAVCARCTTKDCIRGNANSPGCELNLYQPRKSGNMDCTFCLDCLHACPHDNIGVDVVAPGADLLREEHRSSVGRWSRRPDVAALAAVLVFAAFVNAAGMTAPVVEWQEQLTRAVGLTSRLPVVTMGLLLSLVVLPLALAWKHPTFCLTMIPLGFGMWLTHYSFHFFTSAGTIIPATQRFSADAGFTLLGAPEWAYSCCVGAASWLLRLEILFLDVGLLLSLYLTYLQAHNLRAATGKRAATGRERLAAGQAAPYRSRLLMLRVLAPWALLMLLLFAAGVWIVFQPMEMRGTMTP